MATPRMHGARLRCGAEQTQPTPCSPAQSASHTRRGRKPPPPPAASPLPPPTSDCSACCKASLERLGTPYIDLYYMHRKDPDVDIEDTMRELKLLVQEGKIRHIGLSEVTPEDLRRAHAVHPIAAVQLEWSLWSRDAEVGGRGALEGEERERVVVFGGLGMATQ